MQILSANHHHLRTQKERREMSEPTEKDVERAREIFKHRFITDWMKNDPDGSRREMFIGHLITDIAQAIADQRERDALIAENFKFMSDCNCDRDERIAAKIRKGE